MNKLKEMIDEFDEKDEEGKVIRVNKFKNCYTERVLYGKKTCKFSSLYEEYMSGILTRQPSLYRYVRGNQDYDPL